MTTHPRRWLRYFGALCIVAISAVLLVSVLPSRLQAQPYAAVIMDARTGDILYQTDNATARIHPASLTKMMTLYIAFEALQNGEITLDTPVRISRHAAAQPPSRLGLRAGQTIAFRYLIRAAALRSGNDAAVAIAEAIEGSVANFAVRMNRTARAIGMSRTNFVNPHGLTASGHLSSARDMSILGRQLYFDYPDYYGIFSRLSENAGIATVQNTNRRFLSAYRGADGIKTGFTNAAGYNLTAMAERDGVRILVTVMGARSSEQRFQRVTQLMDRGFREAPRRATTRRPARPDYVRAPEDRGSGVAAGRTIRLQTAPTASPFPRRRPQPGDAPSEVLLASLRSGIDEVIEEIREPDAASDTDDPGVEPGVTSEEPEDSIDDPVLADAGAAPVQTALVAPERSPLPRARPQAAVALAEAAQPAAEIPDVEVARAAGFTVIDPVQYAALTESGPELPEAAAPEPPAETVVETADPAATEVAVIDGAIAIPGLPPIPTETAAAAPEAPAPEATAESPPETRIAAAPMLPALEPATTELSVDDEGRILWRDEELLQALDHEDPEAPILAPTIVLTSTADAPAAAPAATPMPEIVTRVSTSGGRLWTVELGQYPSRFDAERVLLRLSLAESGTLGGGVRRVGTRGGRFIPEVHSLAQDEAELACLRLTARDQACSVVGP